MWPGREVHPPFDEYFPPLTPARGQGLTSPAQPSPAQPSPAWPRLWSRNLFISSAESPVSPTSTSTSILHPATTRDGEMASMRQLLGPHQLSIGQLRCQHLNISTSCKTDFSLHYSNLDHFLNTSDGSDYRIAQLSTIASITGLIFTFTNQSRARR